MQTNPILCCADLHITDKCPRSRKDDYFQTQYDKVEFLLKTASKNNARLLVAGDFFDSVRTSHYVLQKYIELFNRYLLKTITYVIPGQHDLCFHNENMDNAPLTVLDKAGSIKLVDGSVGGIDFIGWGKDIPEKSKNEILVIHKMVVDEKLWASQEGHTYGYALLKNTGYQLILSGDNHQQFTMEYKGRFLVNPGSLMRKTSNQTQHKPACWLYKDNSITKIPIPIKPAEEVFDFEKLENEKEVNEQLQTFVNGLTDSDVQGLDFIENVYHYIKQNKIEKDVEDIIKEVFENAHIIK